MSIRKRGDSYQIRFAINGHRYEFSAGKGATLAQAKAIEAQARRDIVQGGITKPRYTLADAAARWLEGEGKHLKDYNKNLSNIAKIRGFLNVDIAKAQDAARGIIEEWPGLKPATINRRLAIIRRLVNLAWKWGWVDYPVKIELLPGEEERHVYLTVPEVIKLAKRADRAKWHVILAAFTGMREGEILSLKPEWIHDDRIVIPAKATKSGKPKAIPLIAPALAAIKHLDWSINYNTLRSNFERARGDQDIRFHDLRHTCASFMVKSGASLVAVRDMLGHANLAVTSRYSHLATDGLMREAKKMMSGSKSGQMDKKGSGRKGRNAA